MYRIEVSIVASSRPSDTAVRTSRRRRAGACLLVVVASFSGHASCECAFHHSRTAEDGRQHSSGYLSRRVRELRPVSDGEGGAAWRDSQRSVASIAKTSVSVHSPLFHQSCRRCASWTMLTAPASVADAVLRASI